MVTKGQYTLDADPMVLARRVETLERACDVMSGCLVDLTDSTRRIVADVEAVMGEHYPLQAQTLHTEHEVLTHVRDMAHAMSVLMGRSY